MNFSLIIGCGGAGIAAMGEAVRLLAVRPGGLERVACLAVDGDQGALDGVASWAGRRLEKGHGKLLMRALRIGREDLVALEGAFRGASEKGRGRLEENWWTDGQGRPFSGRGRSPIEVYGATWSALPRIEGTVSDLLEELRRRDSANPDVLRDLRVYVVAGLAGATGRGSWHLVAAKVRECLRKVGVEVWPTGVFFTGGVYKSLWPNLGAEWLTDAYVNALTGLSELSGWQENGRRCGDGRVAWRLPSLRSPENPETDVLFDDSRDASCGGPLARAYLVCGDNSGWVPGGPQAYHRMAGKALYAMIEAPGHEARFVNDTDLYKGLAGATFGVDAVHIHAFCETLARERALERLAVMPREDVGMVAAMVEDVLSECPPDAPKDAEDFRPDAKGTLYQRVAQATVETEAWRREIEAIREDLKACGSVEDAENRVLPLERPEWEEPVREALERTLRGIDFGKVAEKATQVFWGRYGRNPSVGRLEAFLDFLGGRIGKALNAAPESLEMATEDGGRQVPDAAVREGLHGRAYRSIMQRLERRPYDGAALDELCGERGLIPRGVLAAMYPVVKAGIDAKLEELLRRISELLARCRSVLEACRRARKAFGLEEGVAAGGGAGDDGFRLLFATPDRIEETLCARDDARRLYHRVLKPIASSREDVERIVGNAMERRVNPKPLAERVLGLAMLGAGEGGRDTERLAEEVKRAALEHVALPWAFMEEHYAFLRVLENNLPHWNRAIGAVWGDPVKRAKLMDRFQVTLGVEPERDELEKTQYELPPVDVLCWTVAKSLASVCEPWWMAETGEGAREGVVLVPFRMPLGAREATMALEKGGGCFEVHGLETERGTPFAYVAQAEEGVRLTKEEEEGGLHPLDKVWSLDVWTESVIRERLQLVEREDGASVFGAEGGTPGEGYVSPLYVRNEKLSGCRWKPWMEESGEEE